MITLVKKFFKTKVVFSGRPAIHVHDQANDRILDAHQETNQFARDTIVLWIPLFDTNTKTGGLKIYEKSHLKGYLKHSLEHPKLGKKAWTKKYTHIDKKSAQYSTLLLYKDFSKQYAKEKTRYMLP